MAGHFVHYGLQDESLQVTILYGTLTLIPANDTNETKTDSRMCLKVEKCPISLLTKIY